MRLTLTIVPRDIGGFAYGLLDVLNSHFQQVLGITKLQSTLLQLAYFGAYIVYSPIAGVFMRRYGYKASLVRTALLGINVTIVWLAERHPHGADALFARRNLLLALRRVLKIWRLRRVHLRHRDRPGCGLSCLEVAANSYITVLGSPRYAAMRLNFSQGFQGVASFAGPLIASTYFFRGKNATTLDTVQWYVASPFLHFPILRTPWNPCSWAEADVWLACRVYLAVAGLGIVLNILFFFCELPEITEEALTQEIMDAGVVDDIGPFYKQYRCIFGFVAQTTYVCVPPFHSALIPRPDAGADADNIQSSRLRAAGAYPKFHLFTFRIADPGLSLPYPPLSAGLHDRLTFHSFIGVLILRFVDPALLLAIYGLMCCTFSLAVALATGDAGIACLYCLFFFESICYPCIFTLGTKNLGVHTKRGSGLIVMGVGGGAWYPPAQGALADKTFTAHSYLVPFSGYVVMTIYAAGLCVDQAVKDGRFRFRNIDELAVSKDRRRGKGGPGSSSESADADVDVDEDKKLGTDIDYKEVS
ncbi:hypothetical protein EVG20_g5200 [Dentipellis fragilis]|uniref:Major facilitator superfamily (MFS) profile domain-containing protein n=1 Tax=Dentipellis fragilis TaxID=205917 RepID=A0A4Y9YXN3_9AGAM|nr:hypothetical protein EVG20_g5200 [Dentipellis fragilis]